MAGTPTYGYPCGKLAQRVPEGSPMLDVSGDHQPDHRHRLLLRPEAELERYRPDDAVQAALAAVPVPR